MMKRVALALALLFSLSGALAVGTAPHARADSGGNSAAAHTCQHGGYATVFAQDGTGFKNTGQCVSYVAHGGQLAYLHVATSPGSCQFTTSGYGLQPGSVITYTSTAGNITYHGTDPGTVAPDGTYSYSGCAVADTGTVYGTTAGGAIISAPYTISY